MSTSSVAYRLQIKRRPYRPANGVARHDTVGLHLIDDADDLSNGHHCTLSAPLFRIGVSRLFFTIWPMVAR
jgi:hypothetical protein